MDGWRRLRGVLFIVVKAYEWTVEDQRTAHTTVTNEFFTWYFMLTGRAPDSTWWWGMMILTDRCSGTSGAPSRTAASPDGGVRAPPIWHMVDLLWIVIFGVDLRDAMRR